MIFKSYPKYIPCSIQWFTEIPQGWKEVRVEQYLVKKDENIGSLWSSTQLLSLTQKGVIEKDINDGKGKTHSDYSTYQAIDKGDLVFCLFDIDETPRTVGLSTKKGMITSAYTAFKSKENINTQYVYYFFESLDDAKALKPYYKGLRKTVRPPEFLKIHVPFPPKEEQDVISKFLYSETSRIDNLIAKQEKLIELLEEQRKSIISHAVTKGLNPNAPMKDSGVEWLGEVPESWVEQKIKFISKLINEKTSEKSNVIALENIESWTGKYIETESSFESDAVKFKKNDVLFGKLRPYLAKVYLVENQGEAVGDIYVLRPNKLIHPQFLKFFMLSEKFIDYVNSSTNGTKMPRANWDFIGCISIFLPHIKVQHEIVEYLESAVLKIELIINKQISLIEKLKEYRSSIISHAVTGKIDVREFGA